ncbi:lytic transglycosylase domain-containing protein [Stenoxybacter acetivorans]|uniref:lytic transglycosylase domain-containing protein n=1 Tax=Stenoxybacter acetivorans TaxID=422441 RepID=UPI000567E689|nr:lytic transglycosylase domain-containing protein [Stenoxybacter acetivorans]
MTHIPRFFTSSGFAVIGAMLLVACSSQPEVPFKPVVSTTPAVDIMPGSQVPEAAEKVLSDYQWYRAAMDAVRSEDDLLPADFLSRQQPSAMANSVRNQWLKSLGKRNQWDLFRQQYAQLPADVRDKETRCYALLTGIELDSKQSLRNELVWELDKLPEGCNRLLNRETAGGALDRSKAWRRVRGLLAANQITHARNLAQALGSPLPNPLSNINVTAAADLTQGEQEALLYRVTAKNNRIKNDAPELLQQMSGVLTAEQIGFGWAQLGLAQAYNQNAVNALVYFNQADHSQLSDEMWEWYARSALRVQNWHQLSEIIRAMPPELQKTPVWQYWLGRAHGVAGNQAAAQILYRQAAASGRNFYALLAAEALGGSVNTRNNVAVSTKSQINKVAQDGNIARALALFHGAQETNDWDMRRQAQQEWRYAIRHYNEDTLLAASALAYQQGFYEMGILSADKTNDKLNFELRYIAPFKDITLPYAQQAGIDPAWVYGLIRQESRFMIGATSHVGAKGLMQVMPATAREIANKINISADELHSMDGNIRMGTWYLGDIRNRFGDEVMATAAYNAGPARARRWQAEVPLEGAIYAETIPFDETRTYVKNVMANATYYASLFKEPQTSLTRRMGTIPARY